MKRFLLALLAILLLLTLISCENIDEAQSDWARYIELEESIGSYRMLVFLLRSWGTENLVEQLFLRKKSDVIRYLEENGLISENAPPRSMTIPSLNQNSSIKGQTQSPAPLPSLTPPTITLPSPSTSPRQLPQPPAQKSTELYVWIPRTGHKYHSTSYCSGMKSPSYVTRSEAIELSYTKCNKCW